MAVQKGILKYKIDHVQFLTLEQRQRLNKLFDALKKVPNVSAEQSRLEEILGDWTAALNKVNGFSSCNVCALIYITWFFNQSCEDLTLIIVY